MQKHNLCHSAEHAVFCNNLTWEDAPHGKILQADGVISKNYLKEVELDSLNTLVDGFNTGRDKGKFPKTNIHERLENIALQIS